jgi:hypothetical protein
MRFKVQSLVENSMAMAPYVVYRTFMDYGHILFMAFMLYLELYILYLALYLWPLCYI